MWAYSYDESLGSSSVFKILSVTLNPRISARGAYLTFRRSWDSYLRGAIYPGSGGGGGLFNFPKSWPDMIICA